MTVLWIEAAFFLYTFYLSIFWVVNGRRERWDLIINKPRRSGKLMHEEWSKTDDGLCDDGNKRVAYCIRIDAVPLRV